MTFNFIKFISVITITLSSIVSNTYCQQWTQIQNGTSNGDDMVTASISDKAGNLYVTGYSTTTNGKDFCTIKYNSAGVVQWTKTYDGPAHSEDKALGIAVDNAGNIYVTGYSTGIGSGADYTTIKYNSSGNQQWLFRYNTPANADDKALGIAVDNAGYVYVTGYVTLGFPEIYTMKYSPNGESIWGYVFQGNGIGDSKGLGIATDNVNNIYITGYVKDSSSSYDYSTVKYDTSGNVLWSNIYNGNGNEDDRALGIAVDAAGNFIYATGYSSDSVNGTDYTTIKYNSHTGDTLWVRKYNGTANSDDKALGIAVDNEGITYITGTSSGNETGSDYTTIKYSPAGVQLWASVYNNPNANSEDIANSIVVPKQGNFVFVTGSSRSDTAAGSEDIVTVKISSESGQVSQTSRYDGTDHKIDAGQKVVADTSGNIFIAGNTQRTSGNYDWIVFKFLGGDIIKVNEISSVVPKGFNLYQNYPNPFNPSTKIKFDLKSSGNVKLIIYDILGKQVAVLVNEFLKTGTYEAEFNIHAISSGIYFYELSTGEYSDVKKMILAK